MRAIREMMRNITDAWRGFTGAKSRRAEADAAIEELERIIGELSAQSGGGSFGSKRANVARKSASMAKTLLGRALKAAKFAPKIAAKIITFIIKIIKFIIKIIKSAVSFVFAAKSRAASKVKFKIENNDSTRDKTAEQLCELGKEDQKRGRFDDAAQFYILAAAKGSEEARDILREDYQAGVEFAGLMYGGVSNASTIYGEIKFTAERGHGFAAERANHLRDLLGGKQVQLVGDDNAVNGADRIVNGARIQSKYCATGAACVEECFKNGKYRYLNPDGSPMQVEVPLDKYDDAVRAMENRIRNGKVPGVSDPGKAGELVRKGRFTYEQAKNIARFGTVESLTYDAVNGAITGAAAFGVSSAIAFAVAIWNGKDTDEAIEAALAAGLKAGGVTFAGAVLSGQMVRLGAAKLVSGASGEIVHLMGPRASAALANAFRSGTNIYGAAAMNSLQKMLSSNVIANLAAVLVLSAGDISDIFRGRISCAQLFKNVAGAGASIAGGAAGMIAGACAGSLIPVVGTFAGAVGAFAMGCAGSIAASKAYRAVADRFIEDDANEMYAIIQEEFGNVAFDYLLNKKEAETAADYLKKQKIDASKLKDMYASSDRHRFARELIVPHVERVAKDRKRVRIPIGRQILGGFLSLFARIGGCPAEA